MSVNKEVADGVTQVLGAEAGRVMDGVGNAYQAFLTGQPIYMAERGNEGPEWFTHEAAGQAARDDMEIEAPDGSFAPEQHKDNDIDIG